MIKMAQESLLDKARKIINEVDAEMRELFIKRMRAAEMGSAAVTGTVLTEVAATTVATSWSPIWVLRWLLAKAQLFPVVLHLPAATFVSCTLTLKSMVV